MDIFHEVLIKEKNPQAPELVSIVAGREKSFKSRMAGVEVPAAIKTWGARMDKRLYDRLGLGYVIYGHQPMDHVMALMALRYGMDEKQWPNVFSPHDLCRASGWETGGHVPRHVSLAEQMYYPPIAGGAEFTDYMEAQIGNGLFRTGLTAPTAWAASTAYSVGDQRKALAAWDDTIYECVVSGTSGGAEPTWSTGIGAETTDNTVTWQATKIGILKRAIFIALFTAAPGETGGGTEVSGGSYARVQFDPTDANWTASAPAGAAGRNDNALVITFPAPTASWGLVSDMSMMSRLTGGNSFMFTPLTTSKTVNNADPAPTFPVGSLDIDIS